MSKTELFWGAWGYSRLTTLRPEGLRVLWRQCLRHRAPLLIRGTCSMHGRQVVICFWGGLKRRLLAVCPLGGSFVDRMCELFMYR